MLKLQAELQNSNSELQTSEEELRQNNEELITIQEQLKEKADQLERFVSELEDAKTTAEMAAGQLIEKNILMKRSAQIMDEKNNELRVKQQLLMEQEQKLRDQNKNIQNSINYALRIQKAVIGTPETVEEELPDNLFVLFKPRDVVSGDFYWTHTEGPYVLLVAGDCTGHGVPGAFMTMLGMTLLRKIVENHGLADPSLILTNLQKELEATLHHSQDKVADGMDISLCRIDLRNNTADLASANGQIAITRRLPDGEGIIEVEKFKSPPIGRASLRARYGADFSYTTRTVSLADVEMLYLYTDGYRDQFGGKNGRKFLAKPFIELLKKLSNAPLNKQKSTLDAEFFNWRRGFEQTDDVLVIGFKPITLPRQVQNKLVSTAAITA